MPGCPARGVVGDVPAVSVSLVVLPSVIKNTLLHLHIRSPIIINFTIPLGHGFIDGSDFSSVFPHVKIADSSLYGLWP